MNRYSTYESQKVPSFSSEAGTICGRLYVQYLQPHRTLLDNLHSMAVVKGPHGVLEQFQLLDERRGNQVYPRRQSLPYLQETKFVVLCWWCVKVVRVLIATLVLALTLCS